MGLEPIWSPTRPSNVRVCLFRHDRMIKLVLTTSAKIIIMFLSVKVNIHPLFSSKENHAIITSKKEERKLFS
jgi:hypothetical protein